MLAWLYELRFGELTEGESAGAARGAFFRSVAKSAFPLCSGALNVSTFASAFSLGEITCGFSGKATGLAFVSARLAIKTTLGLGVAAFWTFCKVTSRCGAELPNWFARVRALGGKSLTWTNGIATVLRTAKLRTTRRSHIC